MDIDALNKEKIRPITLYKSLKTGYLKDGKKQSQVMKRFGYIQDKDLSNKEYQTYYNPIDKKLLFNVNGTDVMNPRDIGTDLYLASGFLKNTNRYKESDKAFKQAKNKFQPKETSLTGHSLGHGIVSGIAGKNDKVFTLDGAYTLGQKTRDNTQAYRTQGDIFSTFRDNKVQTLRNPNASTFILPVDNLRSHNVSNIKGSKIII